MHRLFALATLAALSTPAAADWERMGGIENVFSAYADPDTLRREGSSATMRGLYDFDHPDQTVDGQTHYSTVVLREYDCSQARVRLLSFADYSGRMGAGRAIATGENTRRWEAIVAGAVDEAFWRYACGI